MRSPRKSLGKPKPVETRSARNIKWIETNLRVPEGKLVGKPIKLAPFQKKFLQDVYDNPASTRLAILSMGRKNGKTSLIAAIDALHTVGPEAQANSQLVSAAQSRDQAALVFSLCAKMIRMSPTLSPFVTIRDTKKELACQQLGTLYRALSAEASTAYGLSPAVSIHDELGQVKGPVSELYDAIETATAAQQSPISFIISTQAPTDGDLLSILIDDALKSGDPRIVVHLYSTPDGVDIFSEEAIRASNPAFDFFMNKDEVLRMANEAKRMPSKQASYENLICNRRVDANSPFVSRTVWQACGGNTVDDFDGLDVYGALDLSEVADLTAMIRMAHCDGVWNVKSNFWLPGDNLREKSRLDRVPYDVWKEEGFLETTPGPTVNYEWVAARLYQMHVDHPFKKIAFDRWNFRHLKPWLVKAGFSDENVEGDNAIFVEFGQGFQSMSPALMTLESMILEKRIAHGNHPVLTMCAANATVKTDPAGNRKLDKVKSHGRIDGMVALAMCASVAAEDYKAAPLASYMMSEGMVVL
jgi:phage terminase large subunit-like protein